jgi:hypothetical protein
MEVFPFVILGVYGLGGFALLVLLIYFIIKRIEAKKLEDFEKRDN